MSFRPGNDLRATFQRRPIAFGGFAMFAMLCVIYIASIDLRATRGASITGDEPFYVITTQSLLQDGDLDLRQQYDAHSYRDFFDHPDGLWKQSVPIENGEILSPHEPGLAAFVIPGYLINQLLGVQIQLLLVAALTFALTYVLVAKETGALLLSWLVTAAVGLSATAFVYSTEVYPEVPGALCLVLSLLILQARRPGIATAVGLVLLLTALAWLSMKYVPLGCVVAVVYLLQADRRSAVAFIVLSAVSGVAYVGLHLLWFGHLTAYSVNSVYQGAGAVSVVESHLAFTDRFFRLYGIFIDRRFGIGRWAPLFLLVLPSLPLLLTGGRLRLTVAALIVGQLCIATFVAITMMGFWFPGRTMMTVVPLFALSLTVLLLRLPMAMRWGVAGLTAIGAYIAGGLVWASHAHGIRVAVDPFDMTAFGFQAMGRLFPNYQTWSSETVVLTAAWLTLLGIASTATLRMSGAIPLLLSRAGGLPWHQRSERGGSSAGPPP